MPAASDSPTGLPHTWRPLGVRIVGIAGGVFLLLGFAALWVLLPDQIQADFDAFQRGTAILLGIGIGVGIWALTRSRVTASEQGLVVVNGLKTREFDYAQVVAIRLTTGAPWAVLDLADGTTCSVLALQAADGSRAIDGVRAIRALID